MVFGGATFATWGGLVPLPKPPLSSPLGVYRVGKRCRHSSVHIRVVVILYRTHLLESTLLDTGSLATSGKTVILPVPINRLRRLRFTGTFLCNVCDSAGEHSSDESLQTPVSGRALDIWAS